MPKNAVVAHKTGTMPGTANDVAIVTSGKDHVAIAIFTKKGTAKLELREDDLAAAARAAFDAVLTAP
jgi:beta-lactamase class A